MQSRPTKQQIRQALAAMTILSGAPARIPENHEILTELQFSAEEKIKDGDTYEKILETEPITKA